MIWGAICLVFVQVLVIIAGCVAVSMLLRATDTVRRDMADLKREVGEIGSEQARLTQEMGAMKWEHYESLRQHVAALETLARSASVSCEANTESIRYINNKISSRSRDEKKRDREEEKTAEAPADLELRPNFLTEQEMQALMNTPQQAQPPAVNGLPRGFGKTIRGGGY